MTPTTAVPPEVSEYLAAVRAALDDLPATERDDLLAEVEPSLLDAASETGGNVSARLGPAEEFAADQPGPARARDPKTNDTYVLVRAEVYDRMRAVIDGYTRRAGWDDPALDVYEQYRKKP